jgi:hypothetical protein
VIKRLTDPEYRRAFYRAVDARQGVAQQEREYYVPITDERNRGADLRTRLLDVIDLSIGDSVTFVTGPRGSGKTSELLRVGEVLRKLPSPRSFVYTDIEEFLRPDEPIESGRLLTAVVSGLIAAVNTRRPEGKEFDIDGRSFWRRLWSVFSRLRIKVDDLSVGVDVAPVNVAATLRASLNDDESFRTAVVEAMRNSRAQFRQEMHAIIRDLAAALAGESGPRPVVVIDSLDHWRGRGDNYIQVRQSIERVFGESREELTLPGLHVIYCVPSYVRCSWVNTRDMLNVKVLTPGGADFEPGLAQLRDIVAKRAPADGGVDRLFGNEDRLTAISRASGGLFRDLFRLIQEVILNSRALPTSDKAIQEAIVFCRGQIVGGSNGLNREQLDLLAEVARDPAFVPKRSQQADFDFLEALGAILRYPNGPEGHWLGAHPLLREAIGRFGPDSSG